MKTKVTKDKDCVIPPKQKSRKEVHTKIDPDQLVLKKVGFVINDHGGGDGDGEGCGNNPRVIGPGNIGPKINEAVNTKLERVKAVNRNKKLERLAIEKTQAVQQVNEKVVN